jgi:hypothetical protein
MKKFVTAVFIVGLILASSIATPSQATEFNIRSGVNAAHGTGQPTELFGGGGIFTTIANILLFIIGALSVIMLIIGGIRYTISGGNSSAITAAKNTVIYAIVGIIVAILAFAVVNFVINALVGGGSSGGTTNV